MELRFASAVAIFFHRDNEKSKQKGGGVGGLFMTTRAHPCPYLLFYRGCSTLIFNRKAKICETVGLCIYEKFKCNLVNLDLH
jgi:hypothetical protein